MNSDKQSVALETPYPHARFNGGKDHKALRQLVQRFNGDDPNMVPFWIMELRYGLGLLETAGAQQKELLAAIAGILDGKAAYSWSRVIAYDASARPERYPGNMRWPPTNKDEILEYFITKYINEDVAIKSRINLQNLAMSPNESFDSYIERVSMAAETAKWANKPWEARLPKMDFEAVACDRLLFHSAEPLGQRLREKLLERGISLHQATVQSIRDAKVGLAATEPRPLYFSGNSNIAASSNDTMLLASDIAAKSTPFMSGKESTLFGSLFTTLMAPTYPATGQVAIAEVANNDGNAKTPRGVISKKRERIPESEDEGETVSKNEIKSLIKNYLRKTVQALHRDSRGRASASTESLFSSASESENESPIGKRRVKFARSDARREVRHRPADLSKITCWVCGQAGHYARTCRSKAGSKPSDSGEGQVALDKNSMAK